MKALFQLEKTIDQVPLSKDGPGRTPSNVLPGAWLCSVLEDVGLLHTMVRTRMYINDFFTLFSWSRAHFFIGSDPTLHEDKDFAQCSLKTSFYQF